MPNIDPTDFLSGVFDGGDFDPNGQGSMVDLLASTALPEDSATNTTDMVSGLQDIIEEMVDGFEEVLDQNGLFSDVFTSMFDSSSIAAFCADETCFCECFSGDLAQCNTEVISQTCDAFSACALEGFTEGFTEFCSDECGQSSGSDILILCAICIVITCCSEDSSEMEGCLVTSFVAPNQESTPEPLTGESEVTSETNTASDGSQEADLTEASPEEATVEEATEPEAAQLDSSQITGLDFSESEQENSGMTFSSVSFFTAIISTGLVLALH